MSNIRSVLAALVIALAVAPLGAAWAQAPAKPPAAPQVAPPVVPLTASAGAAAAAADRSSATQEYVLGPEDVVEIDVVGTNDRTRARIYTDGTLQTNLIGKVSAEGRSPRQLGAEIAKALKAAGFYADPVVNVEIVNYASRYVTVLGGVGSPGLVPINRPYRLSEILARVGGVREGSADYLIVRSEKGDEKRYNVEKISSGGPTDDPYVAAGDKIFSPIADVFYIQGQVRSPGTYPIKADLTVSQAIARAGGVTDSGNDRNVKIKRGGKELKLNPTDKIEAGDILIIAEKLF